ncbi:iron reductase domain protein [Glonium stellatum]|uniref:Iron reductase domain protein n=1 Tax=Glonium stellatum TaxID=574774 RepID=A0A8E2JLG1_9PEZI|nr:iron reductase domain protein [Glonium stellatum]
MFSYLISVLAVTSILTWGVVGGSPAASTLYLSQTGTQFSINLPSNSSDVYFYFTSPAFSWVAVGPGTKMAGSLMFIMYSSANGLNVTLSPRIATGNTEPTFAKEIQVEALPGTTINNQSFVLNAVCRNCRSWNGGSLDVTSTTQPWMYAFGPTNDITSDSPSAPLRRHRDYGHFQMDMVQATGEGGVPGPSTSMNGASLIGGVIIDGDKASIIHAVLLAFAFLIMFPFNVALVGFFKTAKLHMWFSGLITIFIIIGFALGIYVSGEYNRSKHFDSAHQIFGFIIIAIFIGVAAMGGFQARQHKAAPATSQPSSNGRREPTKLDSTHKWVGRLLWVLGIVNGGLGLQFSDSPMHTQIIYALVTVALALPLAVVYSCIWRKRKVRQDRDEDRDVVLEAYYATQPKPPY